MRDPSRERKFAVAFDSMNMPATLRSRLEVFKVRKEPRFMAETPSTQSSPSPDDKPADAGRRARPVHWAHPVDERRREARARRARRRRVVLLTVALLATALVSAYTYLTSDARVEKFAEQYLRNLLGTQVTIARARFSLGEGLVLDQIAVASPPPFTEPILQAERVYLKIDPLSLVRLSPEVTEIVVRRPRINFVLWDESVWNFQALAKKRPPDAKAPSVRPVVALEEGTVRIQRKLGGESVYEHAMQVSGLLLPSESEADTFRFQADATSQELHLAVASGTLDARTGALRFEGQASNVLLSPELYRSLPSEVQRLWDRFEPTGSINVKILFDEQAGFRLVTEMTGVTFATRYGDQVHKFENLTGRCAFSPAALVLTGVRGLLNGSPVSIDGQVSGFEGESLALDLSVTADHLDFEKSRPLLVGLAPHIGEIYTWYAPRGVVDIEVKVVRAAGPQAVLDVSGKVFCRDLECTYKLFPYRLEQIRGTLRFGPEGYETDRLEGVHGQARVWMEGWAKNPGSRVEARMLVHGRNVPLDADLRAALDDTQRKVYDQYAPSGTADMDLVIYRPPHEDVYPEVTVDLQLLDCQMTFEQFPYRLDHTTGHVIIAPDKTRIVGMRGRHGGAEVVLNGEMLNRPGAEPSVDLKVEGKNVALDDDLAKALPPRERGILDVFHLSGLADITGTVRRGEDTKEELHYDLGIRLKGARMVYEPFPFLAEEVSGDLRLSNGACRIESLSGYNSGARVEARGWIDQRADDYAMDLVLTGKNVLLGESLRGALGPDMRAVWSHLAPRGRVDINAHLAKAFGLKEAPRHHVWVTMRDAQATLDIFPYPMEHVTGQMEFQGSEVLLHNIEARSGLTQFALGGRIAYDQVGPTLDLTVQAKGLRFDGPLNQAVPEPIRKAFAIIHPTGRMDLNLDRLVYRRTPKGEAEALFSGTAVLDEVGLEPGLKIAGVVGTAAMRGRWTEAGVVLDGEVRIQQGKVADKDISNARLVVQKEATSETLSLRKVEGDLYGGRVEGFATVGLTAEGRYALNLAATDVDFERLLRDGFRLEHNITGGRLRATVGLRAGGPGGPGVEASGYVDVTQAKLYELPALVRVLNVLAIGPDERTAFEKARVLYFVRGRRILMGDIRLEGRALSVYGAGTMEPDGALNLMFVTGKKNDDPLIPAFAELAEGIRKQIVVVLVTGTLAEPKVETRTLSALTAPFRELLGLVREQRERERQSANRRPPTPVRGM